MKPMICVCLSAALVLGTLCGCQTEKPTHIPTGDGLYVDTTGPAPTLRPEDVQQELALGYDDSEFMSPYHSGSTANRLVFNLLYQGLFSVDDDYQVHPILCKNYRVSKDMKTYTFYLEQATFADGSLITAADVAASLLAAKENPVYAGRLAQLQDAVVTEDSGVAVTMGVAYENLPLLLDIPIVKAAQVAQELPLGTGPYRLERGENKLWLLRREDWWCRANMPVTADYVSLTAADSPAALRDAFEVGKVNFVCADPGSENHVDFRCDYELWDCESGYFLYLACNEKSKVFSKKPIRAALTHAIDRDLLVTDYYKNFAQSAYLPASPESPCYDEKLAAQYGYDAQILADAVTAAELDSTAVKLLVNKTDGRRVRVAKAIAQMLTECGLTVTVSALGGTSYTNALKNGNYDLHLGQTKLSQNMDLSAFFHTEGTLNYGGLSDVVCYSLCQEAMANTGNYYSLHRTVMDDGMLCPILFRSYAIYVARGAMETLEPARDNLFFYSLGKSMESCKLDT